MNSSKTTFKMDTRILSLFYNKFLTKTKKEINGLVYTVTLNEGDRLSWWV
jgi:hypothetical protein